MSKEIEKLKTLIGKEAEKLLCETHPESCKMRDENYPQFEGLVIDLIFQDEEPVSVQTALAQLEQELGSAIN